MTILALDLGARYCGWALGVPGALSFGTITFRPRNPVGACQAFKRQLDRVPAGLSRIVAEKPVIGSKQHPEIIMTCGWMWRQIEITAVEAGVELVEVNPMTLKKRATGNGHAKDAEMIAAAEFLGHAVKDDHQADAALLLEHFGEPQALRLVG